ncbi:hypothetical protein K0F38_17930 [Bacteroides fragilis]|nr:hypothetical protein [Bacteroides fragilis]MCE8655241.1 hypothetical protein [Bacteroides fragilis]
MITENNNVLEKALQRVRASGILSEGDYDRYLKDILTSVLGFVYKVKIKMITSDMSFFTDYYLPSNSKMSNFQKKDAQYVFEMLIDHFLEYFTAILSVDEISNIKAVRTGNDIIVTSKNWAVGH